MSDNTQAPFPYAQVKRAAEADVSALQRAHESYGTSWKNRGGVGAFMMLARKWDRLENQVKRVGYDIFRAAAEDRRPEGLRDDIRDLRRYLLLVEAEIGGGPEVAKEEAVTGLGGRPLGVREPQKAPHEESPFSRLQGLGPGEGHRPRLAPFRHSSRPGVRVNSRTIPKRKRTI